MEKIQEIRQELDKYLRILNEFVAENAGGVLDTAALEKINQEINAKSKATEDVTVVQKLETLALLPDWLETLNSSLQQFTEVAKTLQPKPATPERKASAFALFPDADQHQRNLSNYQSLKAKQAEKKSQVALLECRHTVKNMADAAAAIGQAERVGFEEQTKRECRFLLSHGFPVEAIVERLEDLLDEKWTKTVSPAKLRKEAERQLALNQLEVDAYVSERASSQSIGHVVHRLLATKYPRPPVPPGECLPRLKVMALLLVSTSDDFLPDLTKVVSEAKVSVVRVQDAVDSCVEAYRREGPGIPLLESREPPTEVAEPVQVTPTARLVPHALLEELEALQPPPTHKEIETQTGPEVEPQLSMAASLGKHALEVMRLRQPLSDWLTTALVIEHLKKISAEGVLGWILVNFPSNFEQARIFEASITGQWVPNPDMPDEDQGGQLSVVQSKIVCDPHSPVEACRPYRTIFTSVVSLSPTEPPPPVVPLVNELYLRQDVLSCLHCSSFTEENVLAVAEMLLKSSPHPPPEPAALQGQVAFPDFEIPADLARGMVALWEALETAYLGHLHRVTLARRTMANLFVRHVNSLKKCFERFLVREDNLQRTVDEFVEWYNAVPRPWVEESKTEIRNRLEVVEKSILSQVEARRREADEEVKRNSEQPVLARTLLEKLQVGGAVAQLELDRFVDTMAVLQDFASASLGKIPPDAKKSVRFEVPKVLGPEVGDSWATALAEALLGPEGPSALPEEFVAYLGSVVESAKAFVTKLVGGQKSAIGKMEKEFQPKKKGKDKKKAKKGKKGPTIDDVPSLADLEEERLRIKRITLLQEWRDMLDSESEQALSAIDREMERQKSEAEMLIEHLRRSGYQVMRAAADGQRSSDSQALYELKEFLEAAIEAEAELEVPQTLPRKSLYLSYLRLPNAPPPPATAAPEERDLAGLVRILRRLAPDGVILLSGLVFLLQQSKAAPWRQLDSEQTARVLRKRLNGGCIVDWRAMVVGLLELPEATEQQLLHAEERLRPGTLEAFTQSRIWLDAAFEDDPESVKRLLYDAYHPRGSVLRLLSAAAIGPCPVASFLKVCALHQGQSLHQDNAVLLEAAVAACHAVSPTENEQIAPLLQSIWNEVNDAGLDSEQRRARNRAVAAGTYVAVDASQVPVELLKENEAFLKLAAELFGKKSFRDLISEELLN
ncbi:Hypothetical predicted protein [Cloeon dipterum]|uniref:Uncharacterized protein n=1 Tax=Cloeon dipterum TaxID=197152 RepID=A0A8S1D1T5_9INSE|nr:Hypothetical predicted protein [Cloeon dipterum]